jgi:cellobiose phosphorylase
VFLICLEALNDPTTSEEGKKNLKELMKYLLEEDNLRLEPIKKQE